MSEIDKKIEQELDKISQNNVIPQNVGTFTGVTDSALQGLSLGFSDEIGAGIGAAFDSVFSDKKFSDAFDERVANERNRYKAFSETNPGTALTANIVGSLAPVAASLLLTPFTGGTSSSVAVAQTAKILSNPLLAGNIVKPGAGLLSKTFEAGKLGAVQGGAAGVGYSEGDVADKAIGGALGTALGTGLGAASPALLTGMGKLFGNLMPKKSSNFTNEEVKAIKLASQQFAEDKIPLEQVIIKIKENVSADKLEGKTPVEILADYGGDAVLRKLRGINTRVPGMNISEQLTERTTGTVEQKAANLSAGDSPNIQSTRISDTLRSSAEKSMKNKQINLEAGIDDIVSAVDEKLDPLYKSAFAKNTNITNLEVYKFLDKDPILKKAYKQAIELYNQKLVARGQNPIEIPQLNKLLIKENGKIVNVSQTLPLEFLDQIKRVADQQTFEKIIKGSINKQMSGPRKKIANDFRELLKNSVKGDEYVNALNQAADSFLLQDAFNLGAKFHKPTATAKAFENQFSKFGTDAEKDAFRIGVFQEIMKDINRVGDSQDLVRKIFNSPDLRQKLSIMFGDDVAARDQFVNKLIREANIARTTNIVSGGPNTAEKLFDANEATQTISDIAVAGSGNPTDAAALRSISSLFSKGRDVIANPLEKASRNVGNVLLEQNPTKQLEMVELMKQLQREQLIRDALLNRTTTGGIRTSANQMNDFLNTMK
tara:strand:+ start:1819 stop:3957 length:2139 start_codon:yes stop_codon:yes gene_type:complete